MITSITGPAANHPIVKAQKEAFSSIYSPKETRKMKENKHTIDRCSGIQPLINRLLQISADGILEYKLMDDDDEKLCKKAVRDQIASANGEDVEV